MKIAMEIEELHCIFNPYLAKKILRRFFENIDLDYVIDKIIFVRMPSYTPPPSRPKRTCEEYGKFQNGRYLVYFHTKKKKCAYTNRNNNKVWMANDSFLMKKIEKVGTKGTSILVKYFLGKKYFQTNIWDWSAIVESSIIVCSPVLTDVPQDVCKNLGDLFLDVKTNRSGRGVMKMVPGVITHGVLNLDKIKTKDVALSSLQYRNPRAHYK